MNKSSNNGVVSVASNHNADDTANKLESILTDKGMKIIARVNHAAAASSIGESLLPTELFIFGNPQAGTPLMQSCQTMALDLPQKILIWQDADDQVWISYNDPEYLAQRHGIDDRAELLGKTADALGGIANAIAGGSVP